MFDIECFSNIKDQRKKQVWDYLVSPSLGSSPAMLRRLRINSKPVRAAHSDAMIGLKNTETTLNNKQKQGPPAPVIFIKPKYFPVERWTWLIWSSSIIISFVRTISSVFIFSAGADPGWSRVRLDSVSWGPVLKGNSKYHHQTERMKYLPALLVITFSSVVLSEFAQVK